MRTQNGRRGFCAKYIQLIQSVWAESRASTQYSSIVNRPQLSAYTNWISCIGIWCNILAFYFASYSIYNLLFYGLNPCRRATAGGPAPGGRKNCQSPMMKTRRMNRRRIRRLLHHRRSQCQSRLCRRRQKSPLLAATRAPPRRRRRRSWSIKNTGRSAGIESTTSVLLWPGTVAAAKED